MHNAHNYTFQPLRKVMTILLSGGLALALLACEQAPSEDKTTTILSSEQLLAKVANNMQIKVGIVNNFADQDCPDDNSTCTHMLLQLTLEQQMPEDWKILFSNLVPVQSVISEEFEVKHLNGDLHQITPKTDALQPGKTYNITLVFSSPLISESVLFPNYLLVDAKGDAKVIQSTTEQTIEGSQTTRPMHAMGFENPQQQMRTDNDNIPVPTPALRYERDAQLPVTELLTSTVSVSNRIIPKAFNPQWSQHRVEITQGLKLPAELKSLSFGIKALQTMGMHVSETGIPVSFQLDENLPEEAYTLVITEQNIKLQAANSKGALYGLISLAHLYDEKTSSLPIGNLQDQPAMPFRGLHLDVSRNFRSMDFMLKLLDQMAYYKMNKLHFHLADDEGWRLEIDSLPELTEVGAFRCLDESETTCLLPQLAAGNDRDNQNNGYYSKQDYIHLLQVAKARNIEIIPSLDMPGHSRAAIVSMNARYNKYLIQEQGDKAREFLLTEFEDTSEYRSIQHYNDNTLNPCLPSTYRFITEVINRLVLMHKEAGVELERYHIGADETAGAWKDSPACKALIAESENINSVDQIGPYFIERVANQVANLNIVPAAWSDGLTHANPDNLPEPLHANAWGTLYSGTHNQIHDMVNNNWEVILSLPDVLYFDFPYEADPVEPGYYWGSRYTDSYQVFQFMPFNLPVHAEIWQDKFGNDYQAKQDINLQPNKTITGIQGQLWSETVRSDERSEYMLYPRLIAMAERAWHTPKWAEPYAQNTSYSAQTNHFDVKQVEAMNKDWAEFTNVLTTKALPNLVESGIEPRVPLPGGKIENGKLYLSSPFVGLNLEFKTAEGDWTLYTKPTVVKGNVIIRANIPNTNVYSRYQSITQ
ncbi:family 20 glycosylhydrolase [Glaciecola sp. 1036]|uniref:family 20 glycosylhydrolase n=1 Tax=Alteromonadaceae TaxID=72275 RepID=UPI003CFFCB52